MRADKSAPLINQPPAKSAIEYRRLRAPQLHGETLQVPSLSEAADLWSANLALNHDHVSLGEISLAKLQQLGRAEVVDQAVAYTGQYLNVESPIRSAEKILMAGHQPELFHPGVWYKNFALSHLAKQFDGIAINLIVDNDICGNTSIRFPNVDGDNVSVGTIPITQPGPNVPFEARQIEDIAFFEKFPSRVGKAIKPLVEHPLVDRLWQQIADGRQQLGEIRLGQALAMGRHRLENEIGLATLEVPLSLVSQTEAFAIFAKSVLMEIERFQTVYNTALNEFREIHKVRSRSHPVPELESDGDWIECPFWIWDTDQPNRRRLFIRQLEGLIHLTDRAGWRVEMAPKTFCEQFQSLSKQGFAIRPKALMTTMFSRLILSDLFLHGIGGAKYDQLTDVIATRFFKAVPPNFMTLSATMKLKHNLETAEPNDIARIDPLIRELRFHPELHIRPEMLAQAQGFIDAKQEWIGESNSQQNSKARHDSMARLNDQLRAFVEPSVEEAMMTKKRMQSRLRASEILNSREYSFCLFPETLIEDLGQF